MTCIAPPVDALKALACDIGMATAAEVEQLLSAVQSVQSWTAGREVEAIARAAHLNAQGSGVDPEDALRQQQRASSKNARKKTKRARAASKAPALADALTGGDTTPGHIDALANAASNLEPEQKEQLFDLANESASAATTLSVEAYQRHLGKMVDKVRRDEGLDRDAEQRRSTKVRKWVNAKTGMHIVMAELHPELGAAVFAGIDNEVERLWRSQTRGVTGNTVMPDSARKNEQLAAEALGSLVRSGHAGACSSVPEVLVLIDDKTMESGIHDDSVSETSLGAYLPPDTIRRLCCDAHVQPVIRRTDGTVLNVGRKARTANRAQRRALRAMYRSCAFDGCTKPFDWCEVHHVTPWSEFGLTDLDNLIPLCHLHHHKVHEGKWSLKLLPDRTLKTYRPNGEHFSTMPPPKLRDVEPSGSPPSRS